MAKHTVRSLRDYLHRVSEDDGTRKDADLLRRFAEAGDHRAFEAILERHGPMVLGTARRLVHNAADAEDVFQATFLSLARLAKSIRRGQTVPNWLYAATRRIAARVRRRRTVSIEKVPEPSIDGAAEADLAWREVRAAIDEELARLPERLRSPLLLCYLSGLSRDEAAEQLGWSLGTLKRRLEAGRAALRARLERRGIPAAGLALAVLSPSALDAAVRPTLIKACLSALSGREVAAGVTSLTLTATTFKEIAMKAVFVSLALAGIAIGIDSLPGRAEISRLIEVVNTDDPNGAAKRVDGLGDPLPDGAIIRLGTRRHRAYADHPALAFRWQSRPDGKSYLVVQGNGDTREVRRIDAGSGAAVESWPIARSRGSVAWAKRDDDVVAFSPDGRYVLFTNEYIHHGVVEEAQDWHLTLYDLTARKPAWSVTKKLEPKDWPEVSKCLFSADNKFLVTTRHGSEVVRLWDAGTGKQLWEYRHKGQSLSPVGFADGGDTLVLIGDNDGTVYLFDRAKGTEKKAFPTARPQSWGRTLLSPDGKHLVLCTTQPPSVWDLEGKRVAELDGHTTWANVAAFSPDSKRLFTGSYDSFVIEREWPSGKQVRKIELGRDRMNGMAVSPDGKRLEVVFEGEQSLGFYDLGTGKRLPDPIDGHRSTVYGVECAPDGSLVTFGSDRSIRTWDLKQGKSAARFAVDLDLNGRGFALSPDGARVATPNYDVKSIDVFDRATGKRLRNIPADHYSGQYLAFSPDGRFLASVVGSNRSAQVFDAGTGAEVLKVKAENACNTVAGGFSPDGRTFAFGDGGRLRFWNTSTWKEGGGFPIAAPWGLARLQYSPDGRTIATASEFGDGVRLYEVATGLERAHVNPPGSTSGILRFSHDGRRLGWVTDYHKVHVLDVRTGAMAGPFRGHDERITGLAFTIDDKAVASSSADSTILVWDLPASSFARPAPGKESGRDWQALRGEDAQQAFAAVRRLAAQPEATLKLAGENLKPSEPIDPRWVATRLKDLDSDDFTQRERATRELEASGDRVATALQRFLTAEPSAEARGRAEKLLERIRRQVATGEALQALRALEVLEWIGTAEAKALVENLAKGAEGVRLTEEAKRILKRWKSTEE